jgi:hypothetical protein
MEGEEPRVLTGVSTLCRDGKPDECPGTRHPPSTAAKPYSAFAPATKYQRERETSFREVPAFPSGTLPVRR